MVFAGMPADVWQYPTWMDAYSVDQYNCNTATLRACFEAQGILALTGEQQLAGVCVADRVGHVHMDDEELVRDAFFTWVARACALPGQARVPPPPTRRHR